MLPNDAGIRISEWTQKSTRLRNFSWMMILDYCVQVASRNCEFMLQGDWPCDHVPKTIKLMAHAFGIDEIRYRSSCNLHGAHRHIMRSISALCYRPRFKARMVQQ